MGSILSMNYMKVVVLDLRIFFWAQPYPSSYVAATGHCCFVHYLFTHCLHCALVRCFRLDIDPVLLCTPMSQLFSLSPAHVPASQFDILLMLVPVPWRMRSKYKLKAKV